MKRVRYPERITVLPLQLLLGLLSVGPFFFLGIYLHLVHGTAWATVVFVIPGFVIFALASRLLLRTIYGGMPCPTCGRTGLKWTTTNDARRRHLLICRDCLIEWETGHDDSGGD